MAQAYSSAIAEYLKATYAEAHATPDTVFIGKQVEISPLVWTIVDPLTVPAW